MYIEKWYRTKADVITYGGVRIDQKSKTKNQSQNAKFKVLFVGRISKDNGVRKYVEILEGLKNNNIKFEFEAIGDGALRKEFEKFGKVYGFVENPNVFIQKADVIFASSYLSILESLAMSKFIVSVYDNPLKKDYLKMTPFENNIVVTNDPTAAVDKILEFINNKKRSKIIQSGLDWAKKQTWQKLAEEYVKLWSI